MSHIYLEASVRISEITYFREFSYPTVLLQNVKRNTQNFPFLGNLTLLKQRS